MKLILMLAVAMTVALHAGVGGAGALEPAEQCAVDKLKAIAKHSQCLTKSGEKAFKKELDAGAEEDLVQQCRAELVESFEKAEGRASAKGGECFTVGDAASVHDGHVSACCPLCGC